MVFFGPERWRDLPGPDEAEPGELSGPGPDHEPHESPWTMTVPLVVLSLFAVVGGLINLPFSDDLKRLEHWLEPVVHGAEHHAHPLGVDPGGSWPSWPPWRGSSASPWRSPSTSSTGSPEPRSSGRCWPTAGTSTETIARFVGGPGLKSFDLTAAFDSQIVDGAVNGVATVVRRTGDRLRAWQSGYVRSYALIVAIGALLLLGFVLTRVNL